MDPEFIEDALRGLFDTASSLLQRGLLTEPRVVVERDRIDVRPWDGRTVQRAESSVGRYCILNIYIYIFGGKRK